MKTAKQIIILALLSCSLLISNALAAPVDISADNLSFIVSAKEAHLTEIKTNQYQILLEGVNPYVTYFTHRPDRTSGLATVTNFIKAWSVGKNSFAENAPNATLTAAVIEGVVNKGSKATVFQLSKPKYSFSNNAMSFVATPVDTNNEPVIKKINYNEINLIIN